MRTALESTFSAIEEAKADVMGAYNVLYLVQRGEMPSTLHDELLLSYFVGLFRSVRFGVAEAHGQGAALQINRFLDEGAARLNPSTSKLHVDLSKLEASIGKLVHDLCVLEWNGDKQAAETFLSRWAVMSNPIKTTMTGTDAIPIDLTPVYPMAGESAPSR